MISTRRLAAVLLCLGVSIHAAPTHAEEAPSGNPVPQASRTCRDMNGREFSWSWSNVPFASSCTGATPKEVTVRETEACRAVCKERFGSCAPGSLDKATIDACFDGLETCQASCAGKRN